MAEELEEVIKVFINKKWIKRRKYERRKEGFKYKKETWNEGKGKQGRRSDAKSIYVNKQEGSE